MAKKQFFLIIDTETTIDDTVADFGAIICDRNGSIFHECAVLIKGEFDEKDLFHDRSNSGTQWSIDTLAKRKANYISMLNSGQRMLASSNAVNRWLEKVNAKYNPEMTAYNLAFDVSKCQNTGIDLSIFNNRFCLWHMACGHFAKTKAYKQFLLDNGGFTEKLNMRTNAEIMASFISGEMLPPEPHTAIEDTKFYELPILKAIIAKRNWREKLIPYNWREYKLKDNYTPV